MKVKEKNDYFFPTGRQKPPGEKTKTMTIDGIKKQCEKHGMTFLPPDDEIYREPPSITFINRPPKSEPADSDKIVK